MVESCKAIAGTIRPTEQAMMTWSF